MHVSVRPTTGRPAIVVTPVGSGTSSTDCAEPTVIVRVEVVTLPALSSASTASVTVRPTSAADGTGASGTGTRPSAARAGRRR